MSTGVAIPKNLPDDGGAWETNSDLRDVTDSILDKHGAADEQDFKRERFAAIRAQIAAFRANKG